MSLAYQVDEIEIQLLKIEPQCIRISAKGFANTTGWTNPRLEPYQYINFKPDDGIQDFEFEYTAPKAGQITIPVMNEITADTVMVLPPWLKGVRIHSRTNKKERLVDFEMQPIEACLQLTSDGHAPWPDLSGFRGVQEGTVTGSTRVSVTAGSAN